jgi:hypothetical protein
MVENNRASREARRTRKQLATQSKCRCEIIDGWFWLEQKSADRVTAAPAIPACCISVAVATNRVQCKKPQSCFRSVSWPTHAGDELHRSRHGSCASSRHVIPVHRSDKAGAGEGNRTLVFSLEGCCSTIELHPRRARCTNTPARRSQPRSSARSLQSWRHSPDHGCLLTRRGSVTILRLPSTTKGGDPVSCIKRCHLAGIAR